MVNSLKGVSSRRYGQAGYPKPYGKDAFYLNHRGYPNRLNSKLRNQNPRDR